MAAKKLGFRPTLRETLKRNELATRYYATMAGKPVPEPAIVLPEKRERAAPVQREAPVVAAIAELLAVHPKVAFGCRQNSGSASFEAKSGKWQPVNFYNIITHSKKDMTIVDFWGFLKSGRIYAFEAKAPGWSKPRDEREFRQAAFLMLVRNCGGIAAFCTSADDVANALR